MVVAAVSGQTVTPDLTEVYGVTTSADTDNGLGKDAFLKLLVAQLKHQDPLNPSSSEDFIATTAQFASLEKLEELAEQGRENQSITSLTTATALIGKQITVKDTEGTSVDAVVTGSKIVNGEVFVVTDLGTVGLDQILAISAPTDGTNSDTESGTESDTQIETETEVETTTDTTQSTEASGSTESATTDSSSDQTPESTLEQTTELNGTDASDTVTPESSGESATDPDLEGIASSMSRISQLAALRFSQSASVSTVSNKES